MPRADLKPYLKAIEEAIIRPAPPWPADAVRFMADNGVSLIGWYDGDGSDDRARVYLALDDPKHTDPEELLRTLSEEICHHIDNQLTDPAAKARAIGLLGYSRWRAAVAVRLLALPRKKQ